MSWQFSSYDIKLFNANCYLAAGGDDSIATVAKPFREHFNEMTMPYLMACCGMKYTTETKGAAEFEGRTLDSVEFLKRGFVYDRSLGKWIAPLRKTAIAEMMNWTKKGMEGDQIAVDNILNALREISLHEKPMFDQWRFDLLAIKQKWYPDIEPHGTIPSTWERARAETLQLDYHY